MYIFLFQNVQINLYSIMYISKYKNTIQNRNIHFKIQNKYFKIKNLKCINMQLYIPNYILINMKHGQFSHSPPPWGATSK